MRIGVMLRDIGDQTDAPGIIVLNLMDELLKQDRKNDYVLFYRSPSFIDRYQHYSNVKAVLVTAAHKLLWDQWAVPKAARKEKVDLIFHPKHSIPLLFGKKTVMQLRGTEYWENPKYYEFLDLLYQRIALKLFSRKADALFAESHYACRSFIQYLNIPEDKISVSYLAANRNFKPITGQTLLECKAKYDLPEDFLFTVTRVVQGKKVYPGKNIYNMLDAFRQCKSRGKIKFVIAGRQTKAFIANTLAKDDPLLQDLVVLDFVEQKDLPALYSMARLFLFPSINESFGIPIIEAMSCGCPVVTSNTTACDEVGGEVAVKVNPASVDEIADAIDLLAQDEQRRSRVEQGLEWVKQFSWTRAAEETLAVFDRLEE